MHPGYGRASYGMVEEFKVQDGLLFGAVRPGDEVFRFRDEWSYDDYKA